MAERPINSEPVPILPSIAEDPPWPHAPVIHRFVAQPSLPTRDFLDVLDNRQSGCANGHIPEDLSAEKLGTIIHHTTRLRTRRTDGRFGRWESRSAPSAGGIHGIRVIVLPVSGDAPQGLHDPDNHAIIELPGAGKASLNARSFLDELGLPPVGVFLQFVANEPAYRTRYENADTLIARDAGALVTVICLVTEWMGCHCRPLGHIDKGIASAAGLGPSFTGMGGVLLTGQ
ncbi:hypothetical protein [Erythrobacter sp. MTPC3]|uniref:hypothetical protein n=1 Tax=Erythrobacter sp. MTPC3 TaxID=3056564 RepID=UPI0036F1A4AB